MTKLIAALLQPSVLSQDAMHGADRAEINAFIDQGGIDLHWGLVRKALRVQMIEHSMAFGGPQATRRRGAQKPAGIRWHDAPIERGTRHTEGPTGHRFADAITQFQGGA